MKSFIEFIIKGFLISLTATIFFGCCYLLRNVLGILLISKGYKFILVPIVIFCIVALILATWKTMSLILTIKFKNKTKQNEKIN